MTNSHVPADVTVDGSNEPMTDSQPQSGRDGLEHWLQDLRADLSNDPPGWLDRTAVPEPAEGHDVLFSAEPDQQPVGSFAAAPDPQRVGPSVEGSQLGQQIIIPVAVRG